MGKWVGDLGESAELFTIASQSRWMLDLPRFALRQPAENAHSDGMRAEKELLPEKR
jgi:hypothetical protein